jgi:hypothetical protein
MAPEMDVKAPVKPKFIIHVSACVEVPTHVV